ncbi:MAG TPA: hypothetical protein VFM85_01995 [Actinomycetota bacterium]|nr:hypothetical protein [Actinomycetota bacterium]
MDPIQRRAIRNGVVAAAITAVTLFAFEAVRPEASPPQATPPSETASPSPTCEVSWDVLPSIDPDQDGNQLLAVAAAPDGQMWAVGGFGPPEAPAYTLVERWDGELWVVTPTPNAGSVNVLNAVTVAGPEDVWAVGRSSDGVEDLPLIERWDGIEWNLSPVPVIEGGAALYGVAAAGRTVWAVGASRSGDLGAEQALILRWDGKEWSAETLPALPVPSVIRAVTAVSRDDVWAIGAQGDRPLALQFTGKRWRRIPVRGRGQLVAIAPGLGDGAWAVDSSILRWDGTAWRNAGAARRQGVLQGIAAVSAEEAWAVGSSPGTRNGVNRALVQRYDGAGWSIVEGPGIPGSDVLMGAAAAPDGSVWAVGYRDTANRRATLIGRGSVTCA